MAYGGWDIEGEPYNRIGDTQFDWYRSRMQEVELIIGDVFFFALVQMTLKAKTKMVQYRTGQLVMKI